MFGENALTNIREKASGKTAQDEPLTKDEFAESFLYLRQSYTVPF